MHFVSILIIFRNAGFSYILGKEWFVNLGWNTAQCKDWSGGVSSDCSLLFMGADVNCCVCGKLPCNLLNMTVFS